MPQQLPPDCCNLLLTLSFCSRITAMVFAQPKLLQAGHCMKKLGPKLQQHTFSIASAWLQVKVAWGVQGVWWRYPRLRCST